MSTMIEMCRVFWEHEEDTSSSMELLGPLRFSGEFDYSALTLKDVPVPAWIEDRKNTPEQGNKRYK